MKMRIFLLAIIVFFCLNTFAQRDLDVITLKNGNQLLGYIIEQRTGRSITILRYSLHDTITTPIEDVDILSKILVQQFNERKIEKKTDTKEGKDSIVGTKDSVISIKDSVLTGRFNTKKKAYQVAYMAMAGGEHDRVLQGASIGYYIKFNNFYFAGISGSLFSQYLKENNEDNSIFQFNLVLENKLRFTRKTQNKRGAILIGLNAGYAFNKSERNISPVNGTNVYREDTQGNFMLQTNMSFKINTFPNSGFIIEPAVVYYNPVITQYDKAGYYLGYRRGYSISIAFRLGYFF